MSIAKRYVGGHAVSLDLIQEGNLGLIKAVEKFDHTKGFQVFHLRHLVDPAGHHPGYRDQARTLRIPVPFGGDHNKVKKVSSQLLHKNGHEPPPRRFPTSWACRWYKVREIMRVAQEPVSLETPIGEERTAIWEIYSPDDEPPHPRGGLHILLKEQLSEVRATA